MPPNKSSLNTEYLNELWATMPDITNPLSTKASPTPGVLTTSLHHHNGFIERTFPTVKKMLMKARSSGSDVNLALLYIRMTHVDHKIPSPAQLLYNRKVWGNLPVRIRNTLTSRDQIQDHLYQRQMSQKQYHDKHDKDLPPLWSCQVVSIQDREMSRAQIIRRPHP